MDISAVRAAVAAQISSVIPAPLTALAYVPNMPTVPCVYVKPKTINYDRAMRHGCETQDYEVVVIVSKADDVSSQQSLDAYIHGTGSLSIKAAIEAGRAQYGGTAYIGVLDDLWVSACSAYQFYVFGSTQFLGATFDMSVIGDGNV